VNTNTSYSSAVKQNNRPLSTGTAKGGSVHQPKPAQRATPNDKPTGSSDEILAALHRSVLDIQKDIKEIKIDLEHFKTRVLELEHNVESITNPGPNFIARPPSQVNIDMDIVHDTYGQLGNWDDDVETSLPLNQQRSGLSGNTAPSSNTVMKDVLKELETKDNKINALESKLDHLISTINTLVPVTNNQ